MSAAAICIWIDPWNWRVESPPTSGPHFHWQQAQAALDEHDLAAAKQHLQKCLQSWPVNAETHFLLARTCRRMEDYANWRGHIQRADVFGWPQSRINLEMLLMKAQVENTRLAERELAPHLRSIGDNKELIYEALTKGYLKGLRFMDAVSVAGEWIKHQPDAWPPYLYRARAFHSGGSRQNAIHDYQQVLKTGRDRPEIRLSLAVLWMSGGQFTNAIGEYKIFLKEFPKHIPALVGLANCQMSARQTGDARKTLARLLAIEKDNAAGLLMLARLELGAGKPALALKHLKVAEKTAPNEPDVLQALIQTLQQLDQEKLATVYQVRFKSVRDKGKHLSRLKERVRNEPENISLRLEIANGFLELEQDEQGLNWLNSILQFDEKHKPAHDMLAKYYKRTGDERLAAYHRRLAGTNAKISAPAKKNHRPKKSGGE